MNTDYVTSLVVNSVCGSGQWSEQHQITHYSAHVAYFDNPQDVAHLRASTNAVETSSPRQFISDDAMTQTEALSKHLGT